MRAEIEESKEEVSSTEVWKIPEDRKKEKEIPEILECPICLDLF